MQQLFIGEFIGMLIGSTLIIFVISNVLGLTLFKNKTHLEKKGSSLLLSTVIAIYIWYFISGTFTIYTLLINLLASTLLFIFFVFKSEPSSKPETTQVNNKVIEGTDANRVVLGEADGSDDENQEKEDKDEEQKYYYLITIPVLIIFICVISYLAGSNTEHDTISKSQEAKTVSITNPDYLANPGKYIVDYEDTVDTVLPIESPLWVESIGEFESPKMMSLRVSYERTVSGTKIIELAELVIPGITGQYCNEDLLRVYLQKYVVGKYLFVTAETSELGISTWFTPYMHAQLNALPNKFEMYSDLSEQMIIDGFGRIPDIGSPGFLYSDYTSIDNDQRKPYDTQSKLSDPLSFNTNASMWWEQLREKEQISKLKKLGGWAYCTS